MIEIDFENLRGIGLTPWLVNQLGTLRETAPPAALLARVVQTQRESYVLDDGHELRAGRALGPLARELQAGQSSLTAGDWVLAQPDAQGALWIALRIPPATQIARRANDGRRQALASNVDTALLTMGLDADFNPRRMERYIALVQACGVAPVVVLTKADIEPAARERAAELRERLPAALPLRVVNGLSPAARAELAPWLQPGHTLVLLGSSGAGKSTLTNTLTGAPLQPTGGVRAGDGRGRHTTTARFLHRLPEGACIIDTPGLRTWQPDAGSQALAASFDDVQALAGQCRFRDCRHEDEPGCAVRGAVDADRLLNLRKLLRDAERGEQTPLERIAQRRKWKLLGKAGTDRARQKRGW